MFLPLDSKTEKVAQIIRRVHSGRLQNLLVVGCGNGVEAAILSQQLNVQGVGIDIEESFDKQAADYAELKRGDATNLEFADRSFDLVFCYHALEHIHNPSKAVREIHRVLKNGGRFWIGTPNRSRVIGYVGSKNASFSDKVKWNLIDWKARLTGKFRNELGAHAGFTSNELNLLLTEVFSVVDDVTNIYFLEVYKNHHLMMKMIAQSGCSQFIYPSVYFTGLK